MNNKFKLTSVILLIGVFIFSSCKKDEIQQPELLNNNLDNTNMILNRIDNFRTQMNSSKRSDESIYLMMPFGIWRH